MLIIRLNNLIYKVAFVVVILSSSVFVLATSFKRAGGKSQLWFEAEDAGVVHEPLRVVEVSDASNGKGIQAIGNHFVKEGYAKYAFTVPEDGEYILWARCFWLTLCTNSFEVTCDNSYPEVVGEDPLTNQWHWILGARFKLKSGKHELVLWNREERSLVDKFLLTTDASYIPAGTGTSNAVCEDFEENILPDKFNLSNRGRWGIAWEKEAKNRSLYLKAREGGVTDNEKSLIAAEDPESYVYAVAYRSPDSAHANVLIDFNCADEGNYYYASLQGRTIDVYSVKKGVATSIGHTEYQHPVIRSDFQDFSVARKNGKFRIRNNGTLVFEIATPSLTGRGAGIGSASGNVYFDNITINAENRISYSEIFHGDGFAISKRRPETEPQYLEVLKRGRRNWWAVKGEWSDTGFDGFEVVKTIGGSGKDAMIVFGDDYWKDYELEVAVRGRDESGVGILFNFQDSSNYSAFKWIKKDSKWTHELVKVQDDKELVLAEAPAIPMRPGSCNWYKLDFKTKGDSVKVYLDDVLALRAANSGLRGEGKTGFWENSVGTVDLDDIKVTSIPDLRPDPFPSQWEYDLFTIQKTISISYSSWVPANDNIFQMGDSAKGETMCIYKGLLDSSFIYHKKTFPGLPKIETQTSDLPGDINAVYEYVAFVKGTRIVYRWSCAAGILSATKDGRPVFSQKLPSTARSAIAISKTPEDWQILVDGNSFRFRDETVVDSIRLGMGYSGMGKGKIIVKGMLIENTLKSNDQ